MHAKPIAEDTLKALYFEKALTLSAIADLYECSLATVQNYMKKYGMRPRSNSDAQRLRNTDPAKRNQGLPGERNPRYCHGAYIQERVYRKMLVKESCVNCGGVEQLLIHHKNDDHYDNRLENLQVLCNKCHSALHKSEWWSKQKR